MKWIAFALTAVSSLAAVDGARAQDRWSLELRGGAALPTQDLGDLDLATGFGFEGTAEYRPLPHLGVYAGWDWHRFSTEEEIAGPDVDVEETGYALGLRFQHPLRGDAGPALRLRAGGTYNHIEIEDEGEITADSEHGVGWEAGAGLVFDLGGGWRFSPGARFRALSRDLEIGGVETGVDLTYVAIEAGIARRF